MTKEKILLLLIAISMLLIAILPTTVQATEVEEEKWTDFSNAKIEIIGEPTKNVNIEDATTINYKVKISNVTLNPEHIYSIYFHEKDSENKSGLAIKSSAQATLHEGESEGSIKLASAFLQKKADIYVTIAEGTIDSINPQVVLTNKKIDHPELLPKLGNRFRIYFNSINTQTFFFAPNDNKSDRTLKIKIGKVTDTEILKSIKANKSQGFIKLLGYAKKAKDYNYVGTIKYTAKTLSGSNVPTVEMNLTNGAYYFAYIELDDENGLYYPVEDIALYRAKGTKDLVRYSDKEFVWEIAEETKKPTEETPKPEDNKEEPKPQPEQPKTDETEKKEENTIVDTNTVKKEEKQNDPTTAKGSLPQTGEKAILLLVIVVAVLAGIGYVKYRKYQDIK